MKKYLRFYLAVILAIVLLDVVASLASRVLQFDYGKLTWVWFGIYIAAGFVGGKLIGFISGVGAGLVAGFGDATLGWFLSTAIGPYFPNQTQTEYGTLIIVITVIIVSTLGLFFGLIGAGLSQLLKKRSGVG